MGWSKCKAVTVKIKGTPKDVLAIVAKEAKKNGITIAGDEKSGTMADKKKTVKGTYAVKGQEITIKLEEDVVDVFGVYCKLLNDGVKKWFAGK